MQSPPFFAGEGEKSWKRSCFVLQIENCRSLSFFENSSVSITGTAFSNCLGLLLTIWLLHWTTTFPHRSRTLKLPPP
jgi:hypothetical protein